MHKLTGIVESLHSIRETNKQLAESTKSVKILSTSLFRSIFFLCVCVLFHVLVCDADLDAAIHEVERRLQYFSVAGEIEATMRVGFGTKSQSSAASLSSCAVFLPHLLRHRPAGNVKEFFDKFDRLMEAETFFLAHKSYIDADNVLRQIVCCFYPTHHWCRS